MTHAALIASNNLRTERTLLSSATAWVHPPQSDHPVGVDLRLFLNDALSTDVLNGVLELGDGVRALLSDPLSGSKSAAVKAPELVRCWFRGGEHHRKMFFNRRRTGRFSLQDERICLLPRRTLRAALRNGSPGVFHRLWLQTPPL